MRLYCFHEENVVSPILSKDMPHEVEDVIDAKHYKYSSLFFIVHTMGVHVGRIGEHECVSRVHTTCIY